MIGEERERIEEPAWQYASTELPRGCDGREEAGAVTQWWREGAACAVALERPVRIRVTAHGVKLAFFHAARALPPFKLTIPHWQWEQMVRLIAQRAVWVDGFESFVGFTPEALALHGIDAVPVETGTSGENASNFLAM